MFQTRELGYRLLQGADVADYGFSRDVRRDGRNMMMVPCSASALGPANKPAGRRPSPTGR